MKLLVDEMPYYEDDCLFSEPEWNYNEDKEGWIYYCKITHTQCDLTLGECSCLKELQR